MTKENILHNELRTLKEMVYDKCGFELSSLVINKESAAYGACSFELDGRKIEHRISKITPTKTGQFVTVWKRNDRGITAPFDSSDDIDFVVITSKSGDRMGQFIFPKSVLIDKGIISRNGKGGKRGIRVYPLWDITTNRQAEQTKNWQRKYFLPIELNSSADLDLVKKLFGDDL
ncbi:MAG: MepB family protein [Bacteroidia bacterium]